MKRLTGILAVLASALLLFGCAGPNANVEGQASDEAAAECPEGTVAVEDADEAAPLEERCMAEADAERESGLDDANAVNADPEMETDVDGAAAGRIEPGPTSPDGPQEGGDPVPPKGPQD